MSAALMTTASGPTAEPMPLRHPIGLYFILPALILYVVFFVYPFLSSIYLSMTEWNGVKAPVFTGLDNYLRLFADAKMWQALGNNVIWVVLGTIAPIVIGLLVAVLLWSGAKGGLVFRTIYFLPMVVSPVVIGVVWGWIFNPLFGLLNTGLRSIGMGSIAIGWLGNPNTALYAVLIAAVWSYMGFCIVVLYAALQKVDNDLIDAAKLDGANAWLRFVHVILPQIAPVLTMVIVFTVIGGFNVFDLIFIMTRGGPAGASEVIATYTYKKSFVENEVGYGTALSMVMTVLALAAAFITMRVRQRAETE
jgi:raffinose/stachyose/melibiose transport system permease protein